MANCLPVPLPLPSSLLLLPFLRFPLISLPLSLEDSSHIITCTTVRAADPGFARGTMARAGSRSRALRGGREAKPFEAESFLSIFVRKRDKSSSPCQRQTAFCATTRPYYGEGPAIRSAHIWIRHCTVHNCSNIN